MQQSAQVRAFASGESLGRRSAALRCSALRSSAVWPAVEERSVDGICLDLCFCAQLSAHALEVGIYGVIEAKSAANACRPTTKMP
jgi:hypothetical protein